MHSAMIGLVVAAGVCLGVAFLRRDPRIGATGPWHLLGSREPKPVIVVIVGSAKKLADVRAVVRSGEIVAESARAFALQRRHVIAASAEDVGPLLTKIG